MLFVFHGVDRAGSADVRRDHRAAHLEYQRSRGNPVGGPLLDDDGAPCGSLVIYEGSDREEVEAFIRNDPYVLAGLFATTSLHSFVAADWPT